MKLQKKEWIAITIAAILALAAVVTMIVVLQPPTEPEFTPPPFEETAVAGEPTPPEEMGYAPLSSAQMSYAVSLCGKPQVKDGKLEVYLYNPTQNNVWLKVRILDEQGNILGESGLICPDQHVPSVALNTEIQADQAITLKIMGYEPNTYYSAGSVELKTLVSVG